MEFDIDVSGEDILSKNYSICVADKNETIRGFKFSEEMVSALTSNYQHGLYKYSKSKKRRALLKVRIYSIVLFYLFRSLKLKNKEFSLNICRDFDGREKDIENNLRYFLEISLGFKITNFSFGKLDKKSTAHEYARLMRMDNKNLMKTSYVNISLEEIEKFLKK